MGRDKKNKPKKYRNINPLESFARVVSFKDHRIVIPYEDDGRKHGTKAEQEVMSILARANIPNDLVLKPLHVKVPGGENEISDGIILYGDTAFLMQIKSRNIDPDKENLDGRAETRKVRELVSDAYKQVKNNIEYLKRTGTVVFKNQNNSPVSVRYEDYNWVGLVLINHAKFNDINSYKPLDLDNNSENREVPRVILSFQDLEDMSISFNRTPYYFLNYLRSLQYQPSHTLGDDFRRYSTYLVAGIHDYTRHNYFIEYEKVIMEMYETKQMNKAITKNLLFGLDHTLIETKINLQEAFRRKFDNPDLINGKTYLKDFVAYDHNKTGYATLFYNSTSVPSSINLEDELYGIGNDYLRRLDPSIIDKIIVIAVDVSKNNPQKTVGTFLMIK